MDCDIHVRSEKRSFDFGCEQAFPASIKIDSFGIIPACDDDFGLDHDVWVLSADCVFNQQSLCARKLAAPRAEDDLRVSHGACHSGGL
jgi:hypothetical protein